MGKWNQECSAKYEGPPIKRGSVFCSGPDGWFVCDDLELARRIVSAYDKDEDWTITVM